MAGFKELNMGVEMARILVPQEEPVVGTTEGSLQCLC